MITGLRVSGVADAAKRLDTIMRQAQLNSSRSLIKAGLQVEREAKKNIRDFPLIDTGNLRASGFTMWTGGPAPAPVEWKETSKKHKEREIKVDELQKGQNITISEAEEKVRVNGPNQFKVAVSFGAFYALFTHEDGVMRKWIGAKYLQNALTKVTREIPKLFKNILAKGGG